MANKAVITNPKSSLGLTKRPNVWLNIHIGTKHKILQKSVEQGTGLWRKQKHEINVNTYLMFLLLNSNLLHFQFCFAFSMKKVTFPPSSFTAQSSSFFFFSSFSIHPLFLSSSPKTPYFRELIFFYSKPLPALLFPVQRHFHPNHHHAKVATFFATSLMQFALLKRSSLTNQHVSIF